MIGEIMQILASHAGAELGLAHPPAKPVLVTPTPFGREVGESLLSGCGGRADAEKTAMPLPQDMFDRSCEATTNRGDEASARAMPMPIIRG